MSSEAPSDDPTRALELLWGSRPRPRRGPRPGLSLEQVVAAAIEIVEGEGISALSMRRVAQHLGVGTASLYTYVPGRTELIALMLDAMIAEATLPHTLPGDWRKRIETWAREDWADYRRHPWILQVTAERPLPGPNAMAWLDSAVRALEGTGLSEREKIDVIESVDGYIRGMARNALESTAASDAWIAARDAFLGARVDFSRYPALARTLVAGHPSTDEIFEFGLSRILDGVEALIARREERARG
ncbi:TetR/AcrR family transcriptional regulator C-terminal domain-containing protein [Streptomonospora nanhaiensis]|uniref:AcrR family transcriptional regulator n=1 Tax=Streptomonospora nanhaiensis TaxID=1323731 RepID=A0A853BM74_9ACTN|nr:TetR/AcrR family transcriptional regulator C-terminal domain-containing protein [Streptomonospora nanhaiensis]MBV2365112.1 TetR/AcrR family transcriptional regulator C-terminal domain-containing protein [Streptomonospora nanhaiensis]MBX9391916.1 TetR/AcrR family transcriptional regulator C-terminal domain-containing protein [Streptomonospora nanhaiensis]NYI96679.1 AcrR family transcriptional regulator [Streptomonospora nanhaiensis]